LVENNKELFKMTNTLFVRNEAQRILVTKELQGQISDGMYENIDSDERLWNCDVKVSDEVGVNFVILNPVDFDFSEIGFLYDRMIDYVKESIPDYTLEMLTDDLDDIASFISSQVSVKTNDLKKGTRIQLANGWYGTISDNAKGNIRMAIVEGTYTENGSVYSHDIVRAVVNGYWFKVKHTDKQLACKKMVGKLF
jgi:hypothetical protein